MQFSALHNFVKLNEGTNIPLAGHPYHDKTDAELRYIIKDASEAARAMKGTDAKAESKYLDQVNDASTVLYYRKKKKLNEAAEKGKTLYALYVGKRGSGTLHIQFTGDTAAECKQEFKDSWANEHDSDNKKIKYSHRIVKVTDEANFPQKIDESIEDEFEQDFELMETMTDEQKAKREQIVKSMKKKTAEFKDRYGKDWKSVMYATATKEAMNENTDEPYVVALVSGGDVYNYYGRDEMTALEDAFKMTKREAQERAYRLNDYNPGAAVWVALPLSQATPIAESKKSDKDEESEELKDACWDGYEAIGTKKKNGKTVPNCVPVNEDHGNGYYVMVGDKEHCWCATKDEAEEKAAKLKDSGKKATVVQDKDIKESIVDSGNKPLFLFGQSRDTGDYSLLLNGKYRLFFGHVDATDISPNVKFDIDKAFKGDFLMHSAAVLGAMDYENNNRKTHELDLDYYKLPKELLDAYIWGQKAAEEDMRYVNNIKEGKEYEEGSDKSEATEEKGPKGSKKKTKDESCEVKESTNNNFIQSVDDEKNPLNARMGVDKERKAKIEVPSDIKKAATQRIAELKKSIEYYEQKGYNDHSQKQKAIECIEKIMDNLSAGDLEGLKKAQIFVTTLMSPITDLMPANLFVWLANAQNK